MFRLNRASFLEPLTLALLFIVVLLLRLLPGNPVNFNMRLPGFEGGPACFMLNVRRIADKPKRLSRKGKGRAPHLVERRSRDSLSREWLDFPYRPR